MKPIYILTLYACRTGGPEALHQLSDVLLEHGFDARTILYRDCDIHVAGSNEDGAIEERWFIPDEFPDYPRDVEEYAHYRVNTVRSFDFSKTFVIVLPETLAHMAPLFPNHIVLIWWLSVDHGLPSIGKVNLDLFRRANVFHAAQSFYAERVLDALGFNCVAHLSDYTTEMRQFVEPLPMAERPKLAAFNASRKVTANLGAIEACLKALDPDIECVKVQKMTRRQVAELFARARVYVDLGNFPGKDRMPREALAMGCRAIVGCTGAGIETGALATGSNAPHDVASIVLWVMAGDDEERSGAEICAAERKAFTKAAIDVFSRLV